MRAITGPACSFRLASLSGSWRQVKSSNRRGTWARHLGATLLPHRPPTRAAAALAASPPCSLDALYVRCQVRRTVQVTGNQRRHDGIACW